MLEISCDWCKTERTPDTALYSVNVCAMEPVGRGARGRLEMMYSGNLCKECRAKAAKFFREKGHLECGVCGIQVKPEAILDHMAIVHPIHEMRP